MNVPPKGGRWRQLIAAVQAADSDPDRALCQLGRFELEALVGQGGMGIVFKARDPELDRALALKLLALDEAKAEAALLREAQLQAQVSHPNVLTIYEAGKIGEDVYLAMEYVPGTDARAWMHEHLVSWQVILAVMLHAGRGLAAVHDRGLVHADIKPENILIGQDGRVRVADFGIARFLDAHEGAPHEVDIEEGSRLPSTGLPSTGRGTRAYMAPERLERRGGDARSDQFSYCIMLWECLHGIRPFGGETTEQLLTSMAIGNVRVANLDVPIAVNRVIARGFATDPRGRFADMDALLQALVRATLRHERRVGRRLKAASWIAIGAACGLLGYGLRHVTRASGSSDAALGMTAPTVLEVPPEAVDVLVLIEQQEFKRALSLWEQRYYSSRVRESAREDLSLVVAVAFFRSAAQLEQTRPEHALKVAVYTDEVLRSLTEGDIRPDTSMMASAMEEELMTLLRRLRAR